MLKLVFFELHVKFISRIEYGLLITARQYGEVVLPGVAIRFLVLVL